MDLLTKLAPLSNNSSTGVELLDTWYSWEKLMSETPSKPNFESAMELLQGVVQKLESGNLPLEDALKHFEEGVRLTRICQEHLTAAEQRVELLLKADASGVELQSFKP